MIHFPTNKCTITDKWQHNGMQVVWMENDFIKVGVLVGRGADIFEFKYKPKDVNFLLRLPGDIKNPRDSFVQLRDTQNQMEDYYYGGWQEVLPNSAPFNYRGAHLGQHGEAWGIPWNYSIIRDNPEEVSLKCWVNPMRTPLLVEKILTISRGSAELQVDLSVTNQSDTSFDLMWGQHIAFGLPFLEEGAYVNINAQKIVAEPSMPDHRKFKPGVQTEWPNALGLNDNPVDASHIPSSDKDSYSELAFLSGFDDTGNYSIVNEKKHVGFGLEWDSEIFKYVWFWQERYATKDAPWWGSVYAVALEPWTSKWSADPEKAIEDGDWLEIEAKSSISTRIKAMAMDNN